LALEIMKYFVGR